MKELILKMENRSEKMSSSGREVWSGFQASISEEEIIEVVSSNLSEIF